jgi:hypothetical protein
MLDHAEYYRDVAENLRVRAEVTSNAEIREELLLMATKFERLSTYVEIKHKQMEAAQ